MRGAACASGVESPQRPLIGGGGWRVGPEKGGYRASGRQRGLLLIGRCFSHMQEQWFEDFSLKQCTEMIGGKVGVVPAERFPMPCMRPGMKRSASATR